jgi:hypothetical protein
MELDVPPSPEPAQLVGVTSTGSEESARLRILERHVPSWGGDALLLDDFTTDRNSMGGKRELLSDGGTCELGMGRRISPAGEEPFVFLQYHVAKSKRYGSGESLLGLSEDVTVAATATTHRQLMLWLKGDPVRGVASPVYVRLIGTNGSKRTYTIKRLKDRWSPYHFPLAGALRVASAERLRRVMVFVNAKDVNPPLGTILFGGMYLEPPPSKISTPAPADVVEQPQDE